MKIGIDISQIVYTGTGVGEYTKQLIEGLLSLDQAQEEFVLFGSALGKRKVLLDFLEYFTKKNSIENFYLPLPPKVLSFIWNTLHVFPISTLLTKIDIFHTSDWTEPPASVPKITTIHDLIVYKFPQYLPQSIISTQKRKLEWVKKEASAIIAVSQTTKQDIIDYLGIEERKIHVIYSGVNAAYQPQTQEKLEKIRKKYNLPTKYFLCVGTREPRKNLQRIIEAYRQIPQIDIGLVIAGNYGWGSDIGPVDNVTVTGYVPTEDLSALYTGAECLVYASLYEGFGLPILDAMSSKTLVVTSFEGSMREISAGYALYVDPKDTYSIKTGLERVMKLDPEEKGKMIAEAYLHAQNFTWSKTAEQTLNLYRGIV